METNNLDFYESTMQRCIACVQSNCIYSSTLYYKNRGSK